MTQVQSLEPTLTTTTENIAVVYNPSPGQEEGGRAGVDNPIPGSAEAEAGIDKSVPGSAGQLVNKPTWYFQVKDLPPPQKKEKKK